MWSWYLRQLSSRPLLTGMWSTAGILFTGDVIAQQLVEKKVKHDWVRSARMTAIGCFLVGPVLRTWYLTLDKMFGSQMLLSTAMKKLMTDQLCFAPCFLTVFISVNSLLQGNSTDMISDQLKSDLLPILVTNWMVWGPFQTLNFTLIPLQHRLLCANLVALVWNTYLASKANSQIDNIDSRDGKLLLTDK